MLEDDEEIDPEDMKKAMALVTAFMSQDDDLLETALDDVVGDRKVVSHLAGMAFSLLYNYAIMQGVTPEDALRTYALRLASGDYDE